MKQSAKSNWEKFWQKKTEVSEVYSNTDRIVQNLLRVTDLREKKVLEIGAGTGRDSLNLARFGAKIYQLDYAYNALKIMRQVASEQGVQVNLIGGDAFNLPFHDNSFDIVFHQGLLEHFREPAATNLLKENIRIIKPGGILLVDVPQRYHIYTILKHILITFNAWFAGWEREFSIHELEKKLESLGLQKIRSYGEWMYPSLFYRVIREILMKVGIKLPLYPILIPSLSKFRKKIREILLEYRIALYTAVSIGVIARKI